MEGHEGKSSSAEVMIVASVGPVKASIQARVRSNFAVQHLIAAARFARKSADLESSHAGEQFGLFFDEIVSYVSASILSSAAGLEAYINELFLDADVYFPEYRQATPDEIWELAWERIERERTLEKYDRALRLKKQQRFAGGTKAADYTAFQSASALVDARDALIHFKPQWDDEEKSHRMNAQKLAKAGVPPSPFYTPAIFPMGYMSSGMARWAVITSLRFIEAFSNRSGLANKCAKHVHNMNPGDADWPAALS